MFMEEKMNVRFLWEAVMRTEGTLFWLLMHFWGPITVPGNSSMLVAQLCPTLYDPMDHSPPGFSVHGIVQARILEWVSHSLLQEFFPTKGSNLHCRWILYHLGHKGSPNSSWQ